MAFDLDFLTYDGDLSVATETSDLAGFRWSADGTRFYVNAHASFAASTIYAFDTAAAFEIAGATVAEDVDVQTNARGLAFTADGATMFVYVGAVVHQWDLSTPWDVSTATYSGNDLDVSADEPDVTGIDISDDGAFLFVIGLSDFTRRWTLSSPGDLSSATYTDELANITLSNAGAALAVSTSGKHIVQSENSDVAANLWIRNLATAFDLGAGISPGSGTYRDVTADIGAGGPGGVDINPKGTRLVFARGDTLYQFSMPPDFIGWRVGAAAI